MSSERLGRSKSTELAARIARHESKSIQLHSLICVIPRKIGAVFRPSSKESYSTLELFTINEEQSEDAKDRHDTSSAGGWFWSRSRQTRMPHFKLSRRPSNFPAFRIVTKTAANPKNAVEFNSILNAFEFVRFSDFGEKPVGIPLCFLKFRAFLARCGAPQGA